MTETKPGASAARASNNNRKLALLSLVGVFLGCGVALAAWWYLAGQFREVTDNAYVTGGMYHVEPQLAGTVVWVGVDNTEFVKKGQPLVRLGEADLAIALAQAKAQLAQSVQTVANFRARAAQLKAALAAKKIDLAMARDEMERRKGLVEIKAVSRETYDKARAVYESAKASLEASRLDMEAATILSGEGEISAHPQVMSARAALREAFLRMRRAVILAPADGYVAKSSVRVGQLVAPGRPLMSVIPLDDVYVEANFKENQLRHIRLGQPVTLKSDLYGSSVTFAGKVAGFGAGTGGVFSILPAQNATGNWIKIVQRAPVRIDLDKSELANAPLILGLSMLATVDTTSRDGQPLARGGVVERERSASDVFAAQAEGVDELVQTVYQESLEAALPNTPEE